MSASMETYETTEYYTGALQIKRRILKFDLSFNSNSSQTPIDQPPPLKKRKLNEEDAQTQDQSTHLFQFSAPQIFDLITQFAFKNDSCSTLHSLRLVCKDFYALAASINQRRLFPKIHPKIVALVNGLAATRRSIQFRYINGIDYGMDGQYYTGQEGDTLETGMAIWASISPRTQPSLWNAWTINEEKQCLEWDGEDLEDVGQFSKWLVYLINNILDKEYVLSGSVKWKWDVDDGLSDTGTIIVYKIQEKDNVVIVEPGGYALTEVSMEKENDRMWNQYRITNNSKSAVLKFCNAINDKEWIAAHKNIKSTEELFEALGIKDGLLKATRSPTLVSRD